MSDRFVSRAGEFSLTLPEEGARREPPTGTPGRALEAAPGARVPGRPSKGREGALRALGEVSGGGGGATWQPYRSLAPTAR